jgi:predicted DNA-binding protein
MATMQKTTLYLPEELHRRIQQLSDRTGRSQAEIIREALQRFVDEQGKPRLRSLGAGHSREITGKNARDWLRENWHPR